MASITRRLQEIYTNIWGPYKLASIFDKNCIVLLLNKFNHKSQIFMLRNKDKIFVMSKFQLPRVEINKSQPDCLQTDSRGEFIILLFKTFIKNKRSKSDTLHCTYTKKLI